MLEKVFDGWSIVATVAEHGHLAPQIGLDLFEISLFDHHHSICSHCVGSEHLWVDFGCGLAEKVQLALLLVPEASHGARREAGLRYRFVLDSCLTDHML